MSFPLGPTNGQTATLNGIIYTYDSTNRAWTRTSPLLNLSGTASAFASGTNQSVLTAQFLLSENDYIDVSPRVNSLRHYQGHYWFQGHLIG